MEIVAGLASLSIVSCFRTSAFELRPFYVSCTIISTKKVPLNCKFKSKQLVLHVVHIKLINTSLPKIGYRIHYFYDCSYAHNLTKSTQTVGLTKNLTKLSRMSVKQHPRSTTNGKKAKISICNPSTAH